MADTNPLSRGSYNPGVGFGDAAGSGGASTARSTTPYEIAAGAASGSGPIPNIGFGSVIHASNNAPDIGSSVYPPAPDEMAQPQSLGNRQIQVAALDSIIYTLYGVGEPAGILANVYLYGSNWIFWVIWCRGPSAGGGFGVAVLNDGTTAPSLGGSVTHYTGGPTQAIDPTLQTILGASFKETLPNICYSVFTIPSTALDSAPNFTLALYGRAIYDPRRDSTNAYGSGTQRLADPTTWVWARNSALVLADFLVSSVYGAGRAVDWSSVAQAADACDVEVQGEVSRETDALMDQEQSLSAWCASLQRAANCMLVPQGDVIKLVPDVYGSPIATYSHDRGQIVSLTSETIVAPSSLPTVVEIVYTDTTSTPWANGSLLVKRPGVDAGSTPMRKSTVRMPWVLRLTQAQREGYLEINKAWHRRLRFTLEIFDEGLVHEPGDIIAVTYPDSGYDNLICKLVKVAPSPSGWYLFCAADSPDAYVYDRVVP
jgi:Putative phage tail protein